MFGPLWPPLVSISCKCTNQSVSLYVMPYMLRPTFTKQAVYDLGDRHVRTEQLLPLTFLCVCNYGYPNYWLLRNKCCLIIIGRHPAPSGIPGTKTVLQDCLSSFG